MIRRVSIAAAFIAVCLRPAGAAAQPPTAFGPSMTFVGAGVGVTSSGAEGRVEVTAFPERRLVAPRVEAGLAIAPRIGIGVSWVGFGEVNGDHNIARLPVEDRQREQAWIGEVGCAHVGAARAFDVVAGAASCASSARAPCPPARRVRRAGAVRTSPAFTAGFDLPARLAPPSAWRRPDESTGCAGVSSTSTRPRDNSVEFAAFLTLRLTR
jgi:hypothetical protein